MARIATLISPVQHGGIGRLSRASQQAGRATAVGALLFALAVIGSLAERAAGRLHVAIADWDERRRRCAEDRQLWELAQTDPRLMADLVALQQRAESAVR